MDQLSPALKKRRDDTKSEAVAVPQTSCSNNSTSSSRKPRKNVKNAAGNKRLLFYPCDDVANVQKTLEKSKGMKLDLEFHINELFLIPEGTWEICGPKICSVTWYSLRPSENNDSSEEDEPRSWNFWDSSDQSDKEDLSTLKSQMIETINRDYYRKVQAKYGDVWWSIFSHCPHLEFFDHRSKYFDDNPIEKVLTKSLLQKLVNANIVLDRVHSLTESLSLDELGTEEISVFQVFPNLRKIRLAGVDKKNLKEEFLPDFSNLPMTIDKLHFDRYRGMFSSYDSDPDTSLFLYYVKSPHVNNKLKELKAEVEIRPDVCEPLFQFFARLNELEVLELVVKISLEKESVEKFKTELVTIILKSCNLTKLTIRFFCKKHSWEEETSSSNDAEEENLPPFDEDLAQKIRRLHTINLSGFDITKHLPSAAVSAEGDLTCFENLSESSRFVQLLNCNMFKHLAYLSIGTDETKIINLVVLKTICTFLMNLKTLVIHGLEESNLGEPNDSCYYEPTEEKVEELEARLDKLDTIPATSFDKLEHLEMKQGMYMMLVIFSEFHFPSLKHLIVTELDTVEALNMMYDTVRHNIRRILNCLPERVPLLEIFHNDIVFYFKRHIYSDCVEFVTCLPKLEILSFDSDGSQYPMTTKQIIKVYRMRSSLKLIIHGAVWSYNRRTRKMVSKCPGFHADHTVIFIFKSGPCCNFLKN